MSCTVCSLGSLRAFVLSCRGGIRPLLRSSSLLRNKLLAAFFGFAGSNDFRVRVFECYTPAFVGLVCCLMLLRFVSATAFVCNMVLLMTFCGDRDLWMKVRLEPRVHHPKDDKKPDRQTNEGAALHASAFVS
jgi:hypothetical protein